MSAARASVVRRAQQTVEAGCHQKPFDTDGPQNVLRCDRKLGYSLRRQMEDGALYTELHEKKLQNSAM